MLFFFGFDAYKASFMNLSWLDDFPMSALGVHYTAEVPITNPRFGWVDSPLRGGRERSTDSSAFRCKRSGQPTPAGQPPFRGGHQFALLQLPRAGM